MPTRRLDFDALTVAPPVLLTTQQRLQVLANEPATWRLSQQRLTLLETETRAVVTQLRLDWLAADASLAPGPRYLMQAFDASGNQWVYWEASDRYALPSSTIPPAAGELSQLRILQILE